jgi:hypothetical protein
VDDERRCWWKVSAEHEGTVTFEMHAKWLFFVKLPGYGMAPAKREIPAPKRARLEIRAVVFLAGETGASFLVRRCNFSSAQHVV